MNDQLSVHFSSQMTEWSTPSAAFPSAIVIFWGGQLGRAVRMES